MLRVSHTKVVCLLFNIFSYIFYVVALLSHQVDVEKAVSWRGFSVVLGGYRVIRDFFFHSFEPYILGGLLAPLP